MWYPGVDGLDRRVEMDVLGGRDQHHVGFNAIGEEVVVMRIAPAGRQSEIPGEGMAAQVVHIDDGDGCSRSGYRRAYSRYLLARFPAPITTIRTGRETVGSFFIGILQKVISGGAAIRTAGAQSPPAAYPLRRGTPDRLQVSGSGAESSRAVPRGSPGPERDPDGRRPRRLLFAACAQIQHTQVAELDAGTMAQQADMARLVEKPRVVAVVGRIGIDLRTVLGNIMPLAGFADIAVEDHPAVDRDRNAVAHGTYLLGIPLTQLAELHALGRDDAVNRTVLLVIADALVDRRIVVENLYLHPWNAASTPIGVRIPMPLLTPSVRTGTRSAG